MKRTIAITVTYRWWRCDGKPIKKKHMEALEETANDRIMEMLKEGYTSGELVDNIHMTDARDPRDGIAYRGWWDKEEVNDEQR